MKDLKVEWGYTSYSALHWKNEKGEKYYTVRLRCDGMDHSQVIRVDFFAMHPIKKIREICNSGPMTAMEIIEKFRPGLDLVRREVA